MKKIITILLIIFISLICSIKEINAEELPKIYFTGNISNMDTKTDERKIKLTYKSKDLTFDSYALLKIQGSSSLSYEKKNYNIKLYQDENYKVKKKVNIGFGKENKYCLKANWIDFTHSRNIVTARITSSIQEKYNLFTNTPNNGLIDGFPIEIYINNDYLGLYTINIPKDEWMFNMDKNNPNHIVLSATSYTSSAIFNNSIRKDDWEIEIGPNNDETLNKFNRVIEFIMNSTDKEFRENFEDYLNLDATLNYYVMLNTAQLFDNTAKNMLMVTYDGIIWYPSLYDLDTSWGSEWNGLSLFNYNWHVINHNNNSLLWNKFEHNFKNEIANRYFELRKDILTKENILNEFNTFINSIPKETYQKEQAKWNNIPGYDINQIEEFLNIRLPLIDEYMYNLYTTIPTITPKYSTTKYTLFPVKVTLIPNRNDITIYKNNKIIKNNSYTFTKNGEYIFEYKDHKGNTATINIKIDFIIPSKIFISIIIIITFLSLLSFHLIKKNKTNKSTSNPQKGKDKKNKKNTSKKKTNYKKKK